MLRDEFIEGMSHVAATVSVVTTDGPHGQAGLTVSSMCSVSADPPSLLVCVNHSSLSCLTIEKNAVFCVNVLQESQAGTADIFSGRIRRAGSKFDDVPWSTLETGAPVLAGALVAFDCRMTDRIVYGTHVIYIGDPIAIRREKSRNPLVYANRAYGTARAHAGFGDRSVASKQGPVVRIGCFTPLGSYLVPGLVRSFLDRADGCRVEVREGRREALTRGLADGELDLVLAYDMAVEDGLTTEKLAETTPYLLLPAGHSLGKAACVSLASLASEPMVLLDSPPTADYIESIFAAVGLTPRIDYAFASFEMVRGMVAYGFGYSLLMTKPANSMSYDGTALISRPLRERVEPRLVIAAHREDAGLSPDARAFLAHCIERLT